MVSRPDSGGRQSLRATPIGGKFFSFSHLPRHRPAAYSMAFALWCNGNTAVFEAVIHGSNPCGAGRANK